MGSLWAAWARTRACAHGEGGVGGEVGAGGQVGRGGGALVCREGCTKALTPRWHVGTCMHVCLLSMGRWAGGPVCVCARARVCVCVCAGVRACARARARACVCARALVRACVCARCVRARVCARACVLVVDRAYGLELVDHLCVFVRMRVCVRGCRACVCLRARV